MLIEAALARAVKELEPKLDYIKRAADMARANGQTVRAIHIENGESSFSYLEVINLISRIRDECTGIPLNAGEIASKLAERHRVEAERVRGAPDYGFVLNLILEGICEEVGAMPSADRRDRLPTFEQFKMLAVSLARAPNCWCEKGAGKPMVTEHSSPCQELRQLLLDRWDPRGS